MISNVHRNYWMENYRTQQSQDVKLMECLYLYTIQFTGYLYSTQDTYTVHSTILILKSSLNVAIQRDWSHSNTSESRKLETFCSHFSQKTISSSSSSITKLVSHQWASKLRSSSWQSERDREWAQDMSAREREQRKISTSESCWMEKKEERGKSAEREF